MSIQPENLNWRVCREHILLPTKFDPGNNGTVSRQTVKHVKNTPPESHRSDLDGLRALAIPPVLLYHAHPGGPGL